MEMKKVDIWFYCMVVSVIVGGILAPIWFPELVAIATITVFLICIEKLIIT